MWFLQEPHGVTSQKTPFFIVTAVKTSNLTKLITFGTYYESWTSAIPIAFQTQIASPLSCPDIPLVFCAQKPLVHTDRLQRQAHFQATFTNMGPFREVVGCTTNEELLSSS
jgi:hypothetical protein